MGTARLASVYYSIEDEAVPKNIKGIKVFVTGCIRFLPQGITRGVRTDRLTSESVIR